MPDNNGARHRTAPPVFADLAGRDDVDPVVRPSDRADAQVNGALPLAKQLGSQPARGRPAVVDSAGSLAACAPTSRSPGPGSSTSPSTTAFLAGLLAEVAADDRLGVRGLRSPHRGGRLLGAQRRQGDARRPPALHGHRRRPRADARPSLGHTVIRENHIGDWGRPFGMLIEHLLDIGEDAAVEGLSQGDLDGFYKQANAKFDADEAFQERARERVVLLQSGDPETLRLWQRSSSMSTEPTSTGLRPSSACCSPTTTSPARALPAAHARHCRAVSRPPAAQSRATAPRSCSRPGSPTATASRCR
jgi:arginyl-tRNA synthetase